MSFRADLHCHSTFSDGTDTPTQLIERALQSGLSGLAITDHDTIAGYKEAFQAAEERQFCLLNGIEFSAFHGEPVHILGYAFQMKSPEILELCRRHEKRREKRNLSILAKLKKIGIAIDPSSLVHAGTWGRPHIARALLERGLIRTIQEAFDLYLGEGKCAYDPGEPVSVDETISVIHAGKGKAVLAHPQLLKRSTTIRELLKKPFDGVECYYGRLDGAQEKKWIALAKERKWVITGGSDYHGSIKPRNLLGASWVPKETFDQLYQHFLTVNGFSPPSTR